MNLMAQKGGLRVFPGTPQPGLDGKEWTGMGMKALLGTALAGAKNRVFAQ